MVGADKTWTTIRFWKEPFILDDVNSEGIEIDISPEEILDLWQPEEEIMKVIVVKYDDLKQGKVAFANGEL